jgi:hypothetical protein
MSGSQGANVHSLDALKDVRAALIKFQERAITAMGDLRQKVDRTVDWLELDRPSYWREQEHRAYDQLATTRVAYETCRLRTVGGRKSDCIEEKKAFERARVRMDYVREKQRIVQKWMVQAGREANEYRARTSTFQRSLENDVPLMIAQLGRMIDAIEAYTDTGGAHPTSGQVPSLSISSTADAQASAGDSETVKTNDDISGETQDTPRLDLNE